MIKMLNSSTAKILALLLAAVIMIYYKGYFQAGIIIGYSVFATWLSIGLKKPKEIWKRLKLCRNLLRDESYIVYTANNKVCRYSYECNYSDADVLVNAISDNIRSNDVLDEANDILKNCN